MPSNTRGRYAGRIDSDLDLVNPHTQQKSATSVLGGYSDITADSSSDEDADLYANVASYLANLSDDPDPNTEQVHNEAGLGDQQLLVQQIEHTLESPEQPAQKKARSGSDGSAHVPKLDAAETTDDDSTIHKISWIPFDRHGAFSRGVSERVRSVTLSALYDELQAQRRLSPKRVPKPVNELIGSVVKKVMKSRSIAQTDTRNGVVIPLFDPREHFDQYENEILDLVQYLIRKRQILRVIHEYLIQISRNRIETSAEEILGLLDANYPDFFIADRYSTEDIVDWYNNVVIPVSSGKALDEFEPLAATSPSETAGEYIRMPDTLFMGMILRLQQGPMADTQMNALMEEHYSEGIEGAQKMHPIDLLRQWKNVMHEGGSAAFLQFSSDYIEISDGIGGPFRQHSHDKPPAYEDSSLPEYLREIMREWKNEDDEKHDGEKDIAPAVPEKLCNRLFPLPNLIVSSIDKNRLLPLILQKGIMNFPYDESVVFKSIHPKPQANRYSNFLSSLQNLAVIDEEVYLAIRSLYLGIANTLAVYRKERKSTQNLEFGHARDLVQMFRDRDEVKYQYLTVQHVAVWFHFTIAQINSPPGFDGSYKIERLKRYTIPAGGSAGGQRILLFMESAFIDLVQHYLDS